MPANNFTLLNGAISVFDRYFNAPFNNVQLNEAHPREVILVCMFDFLSSFHTEPNACKILSSRKVPLGYSRSRFFNHKDVQSDFRVSLNLLVVLNKICTGIFESCIIL